MQQPPSYNQSNVNYPYQQPPQAPKRTIWRTLWRRFRALPMIMQVPLALLILLFVGSAGISAAHDALFPPSDATPVATSVPTGVKPTAIVHAKPTSVPKAQPTKVPAVAIVATHGTPQLGRNFSDFLGKYGKGNVQLATAPNGDPDGRIGWYTGNGGQDLLTVSYYVSNHMVYSIEYTPYNTVSNADVQKYLVAFFPADATVNTQAPNTDGLIAYTSSEYPHMFLHLNSGTGYINIV